MSKLYILQHEFELWGKEDVKFIGVYSSMQEAELAISRLSTQPGFRDWPEGFTIDEYTLNMDNWSEGFKTIIPIHIQVIGSQPHRWKVAHAIWRPGDLFEIESIDNDENDKLIFSEGQIVSCKFTEIEGSPDCLVATNLAE